MLVGVTVWGDMVSPVLDAAELLLVFETGAADRGVRAEVRLSELGGPRKVAAIVQSDVAVLICGAVTRPLLEMLESEGITVVPWISGRVEDVLTAFAGGRLTDGAFAMPGCRGGRRREPGGPRGTLDARRRGQGPLCQRRGGRGRRRGGGRSGRRSAGSGEPRGG